MSIENARHIYALVIPDETGHDMGPLSVARQLATQCGGMAHALIVGPQPESATQAAQALGFDQITTIATAAANTIPQTHQLSDLLATLLCADGPIKAASNTIFLVGAGAQGEELAGSLSAQLKAVPLGKCDHFELDQQGELNAVRPAFGGRLKLTVDCIHGPFFAAVRKTDTASIANADTATEINHLDANGSLRPTYHIETRTRSEEHAGLDGAKLVVSGGRGIGKAESFELLYDIAAKLGGAVGASLPAIDAGWAPVARQVGQSGKYVSPDIYLAVGISGTPQHLAGIDPHTKIIAINKDPDAGIFRTAYMGVVADWQALLPALADALEQGRSET